MTTAVDSITGDANIWIVRGKKRHGFEFEIKLAFKGCVKVCGQLQRPCVPECCNDVQFSCMKC